MMKRTVIYKTKEIELDCCVLTSEERQVNEIMALQDFGYYVNLFNLRRGNIVAVREVEVTVVVGKERCFKFGYDGALREVCYSRRSEVLSEKRYKLWCTKARGYYWIALVTDYKDCGG